jgi:hypothetical protein
MSGPERSGEAISGLAAGPPGGGWRSAVPEICVAAAVIAVAAAAGYAAAGLPGAALMVTCGAVDVEAIPAAFTGYWRKRAGLVDGTKSMTGYDAELRGTLQHLLAARLAERHGVSLDEDPAAARRLLCPRPRDDGLWYWIDPARPPTTTGTRPGIPPRTLARLINRLEQL